MAEASPIVNARPLVPVSNDPDAPEVLTPATLLTHKPQHLKPLAGEFSAANLSHKQWKPVQHLADVFWLRWRRESLPTLQPRRKWQNTTRNVQKGDLVILHCKDAPRNDWHLARVTIAQADSDGMVHRVDLVTVRGGSRRHFKRPVAEPSCCRQRPNESSWITDTFPSLFFVSL